MTRSNLLFGFFLFFFASAFSISAHAESAQFYPQAKVSAAALPAVKMGSALPPGFMPVPERRRTVVTNRALHIAGQSGRGEVVHRISPSAKKVAPAAIVEPAPPAPTAVDAVNEDMPSDHAAQHVLDLFGENALEN